MHTMRNFSGYVALYWQVRLLHSSLSNAFHVFLFSSRYHSLSILVPSRQHRLKLCMYSWFICLKDNRVLTRFGTLMVFIDILDDTLRFAHVSPSIGIFPNLLQLVFEYLTHGRYVLNIQCAARHLTRYNTMPLWCIQNRNFLVYMANAQRNK